MARKFIPKYGGYKDLEAFKNAEIIFDFTVEFCRRYIDPKSRTNDQMHQAARSGKQNIAEGSLNSATSRQSELRLVNVSRGSLGELLEDYEDFLRQKKLPQWEKDNPRAAEVRKLAYRTHKSYKTYKSYLSSPETAANCMICLINQTNFLLDKLIGRLEDELVKHGDSRENFRAARGDFLKNSIMGKTEWDKKMRDWIARREEAKNKNKPFSEPPPKIV